MGFRSAISKCSLVAALLVPVGLSLAAEYKAIRVGEDATDLPETVRGDALYREGYHQGTWIRTSLFGGKVEHFDVIYSGSFINRKVTIAQEVTLAQAIREHSLREGMAPPQLGYAVDRDGRIYGLADSRNQIVYHVNLQRVGLDSARTYPVATDSGVEKVAYLSDDAPVLESANQHPLENLKATRLLEAARAAPAVPQASSEAELQAIPEDENTFKASNREEAIKKLQEQNDVVLGKERRTLALIRDVAIWFEVDSKHSEEVSKAKQLREFYAAFHEEYGRLLFIYRANERILGRGVLLLEEAMSGSDELESKMRQLKAMGFE